MSRHSKNSTARGFFTYEEKQKLNYGTLKQRLGKDSLRIFNSCWLCLSTAVNPTICPMGHLACKQCILTNLLNQKQSIQHQLKLYQQQQLTQQQQTLSEQQQQQQKQLQEFQNTIKNVGVTHQPKISKEILDAQLKTDPTKVNSFWIPDNTPIANDDLLKSPVTDLFCFCNDIPHVITLKKLINLEFTFDTGGDKIGKDIICPTCSKTFRNGIKMIVLKNCGHVFCSSCADSFVLPSKKCQVCDEKCKEKEMIKIETEGTGFSAHGNIDGKKVREAFQC